MSDRCCMCESAAHMGRSAYAETVSLDAQERGSRLLGRSDDQGMNTAASRLNPQLVSAVALLEAFLLTLEFALVL